MNGAESLVATLVDREVDICFANPGTSEMHFLAALGNNPKMRSVLCLFEGVATGAADGWYRMKDKPASTLLHLGPGLANGLANIHNARRASSGMVNIIGEHSASHLKYDPPLTSDIEGLARPLSHWVRRAESADSIAWDTAQAVSKAGGQPGQIATLILPGDTSWQQARTSLVLPPSSPVSRKAPRSERIEHVARVLRSGEPTLIILANKATRGAALEKAGRIAAATGAQLGSQFFTARIERGAGFVPIARIPYAVPQAIDFLKEFRHIITVETREPVAFFAYPDKPSLLKAEGTQVHELVEADEDSELAFDMLLQELGASGITAKTQTRIETPTPSGTLNPTSIAHALAAAIVTNGAKLIHPNG
ncbi:MAG: acetolactate synthase large subunit [Enterobacterales bacterium endosymbiont of Blomia tropicalis]|uniref:acetolactate synthase large subunit n=1 Tax=Mixta mediterraneensis TaxID=2758443 RepID=UPI0025A6E8EC|nr:acetolactate synthase large subunit [Mixta mediterraneensis]MDL4915095.1 acetolactate synthase large subunit [Mixta mediterraneensis]